MTITMSDNLAPTTLLMAISLVFFNTVKDIKANIPDNSLTKTDSIANAYWFAHRQSKDGWTHELDLRPSVETW